MIHGRYGVLSPQLPFKFLVEAEDRTFTGRMHVSGSASAGFVCLGNVLVKDGRRGGARGRRAGCDACVGGEAEDVACTAAASVKGGACARGAGGSRVGFDDLVGGVGGHFCEVIKLVSRRMCWRWE